MEPTLPASQRLGLRAQVIGAAQALIDMGHLTAEESAGLLAGLSAGAAGRETVTSTMTGSAAARRRALAIAHHLGGRTDPQDRPVALTGGRLERVVVPAAQTPLVASVEQPSGEPFSVVLSQHGTDSS
ncbi:hypothetical protein [Actinoplanes sp. NPDC051411]|uniref:hypothetical protein n=1 Tax=Actinoplanes sp. NPDC051411 TaxID=3155522 RepID=UPI00342651DE